MALRRSPPTPAPTDRLRVSAGGPGPAGSSPPSPQGSGSLPASWEGASNRRWPVRRPGGTLRALASLRLPPLGPLVLILLLLHAPSARCAEDAWFDPVDQALTYYGAGDRVRARVSGALDLEGYHFQQPAPGLLNADASSLFAPRLTVYLDAQAGERLYAFAEAREDTGFDPGLGSSGAELAGAAVRYTPWTDGRLNLQVGKFATVVGSWAPRHDSWTNPFVTAPLPYEFETGLWDTTPARSAGELRAWTRVGDPGVPGDGDIDKTRAIPIVWGPDYATGAEVFGTAGRLDYAAEVKNASLSSRPSAWDPDNGWGHPTFSGRLDARPDELWVLGVSASAGSYLLASAGANLPQGYGRSAFRELVLAQDTGFAWHHVQVWAEVFATRFEDPLLGNADVLAYYVETRLTLTAGLYGAVRWNQELFSPTPGGGPGAPAWGHDVSRGDLAFTYRLTAHTQFKVQGSLQREDQARRDVGTLVAGQFTLRF